MPILISRNEAIARTLPLMRRTRERAQQMAENGQKRDPVNHRTKDQETRHYKKEDKKPEVRERREERHLARAHAIKAGIVRKGDGLELDHRVPLTRGGSNSPGNIRVTSRHENRVKGNKMPKR